MVELRPYQESARQAIRAEWQAGHRKTLTVAATGTGKTVIFGAVANDCVNDGERVLILAHRGELLEQASDKLMDAFGIPTVLEKAESSSLGSLFPSRSARCSHSVRKSASRSFLMITSRQLSWTKRITPCPVHIRMYYSNDQNYRE